MKELFRSMIFIIYSKIIKNNDKILLDLLTEYRESVEIYRPYSLDGVVSMIALITVLTSHINDLGFP